MVPLWYPFLNATRWMDQVPDMSRTPWHMHPLVFLDAISTSKNAAGRTVRCRPAGLRGVKNDYGLQPDIS
ncbi:hypothetical protein CHE29_15790 [Salmonella enterica]|nr:hypothetical protein CHE29_15790 [Salmonella enterica]